MELCKVDFEHLLTSKYKLSENLPVDSKYFFCIDKKIMFIHESRGFYKILSAGVTAEPLYYESVFDVLYSSKDLLDTVHMFKSYISKILTNEKLLKDLL